MAEPLLDEAWRALMPDEAPPARVEITGPRDLLPSVFPVVDLAVAAVGASLLAGAALQRRRAGRAPETIELDTAHVACAVRSERLIQVNGQPVGDGFAPLSRFLPTADGWIRLHGNYPWHRERLLQVLGTPPEVEAVAAAVARWPAVALETAIVEAGGCAAAVRRLEEWREHPQGRAVAAEPLVALQPVESLVDQQAAAPTEPGGMPVRAAAGALPEPGELPASGIRVLDLTRVIAGPVCTRTLASLGADVLRIDSPHLPELPLHTLDTLAGKRSALLDLRQPADRQRLEALLAGAHVVVQGYRPGALARLGLAPDALLARYPGLVVVSLSAWGHSGPWSDRRGFDSLVQAASGIARCEAAGDPHPGVLPAQLLDHATGYLAAAAALVGLARRQADGRGWHARVSLARTAAWVLQQATRPKTAGGALDPAPVQLEHQRPDDRIMLVEPPGRLDGRPLRWPNPPPRYGADPPDWL